MRLAIVRGWGAVMIHQLWGPVFDLTGNGGYNALTFSWFLLKYGNVIEMILVAAIFLLGMFVNLPAGKPGRARHRR